MCASFPPGPRWNDTDILGCLVRFGGMPLHAIIPGGDDPGATVLSRARKADLVIAADSGLDHATRHGVTPDVLVGDMDSVDPASVRRFGGDISIHSPDKDR